MPFNVNRTTKYLCPECEEVCTDTSPDGIDSRDIVTCSECGYSGHHFTSLPDAYSPHEFLLLYSGLDGDIYRWGPNVKDSDLELEDICSNAEKLYEMSCVIEHEVGDSLREACKKLYEQTDKELSDFRACRAVDNHAMVALFKAVKTIYYATPDIHSFFLPDLPPEAPNECVPCDGHGVILACCGKWGDLAIQRCDACGLYKDDNEALMAVFNGYVFHREGSLV
jgi:hypothetical protein